MAQALGKQYLSPASGCRCLYYRVPLIQALARRMCNLLCRGDAGPRPTFARHIYHRASLRDLGLSRCGIAHNSLGISGATTAFEITGLGRAFLPVPKIDAADL